ncbi:MAG: hypothetical protein GY856_15355 [bacterium]|nr:hypothetical protein [bacterium]
MELGAGEGGELLFRDLADRDPVTAAELLELTAPFAGTAQRDEYPLHRPGPPPQELADRMVSVEELDAIAGCRIRAGVVRHRCRLRPP